MAAIAKAYHLVIGPSGSGVSTALDTYSDFGFMQAGEIRPDRLVDTLESLRQHHEHIVLSINLQPENQAHLAQLQASIKALKVDCPEFKVVFLNAPDHYLIQRYLNSGKIHVFGDEGLEQGVSLERSLFLPFQDISDFSIDTSLVAPNELRNTIAKMLGQPTSLDEFTLNIVTFGFKYGIPQDADMLFDMRFLKNPFYEDALREQTGLDEEVKRYIFDLPHAHSFFEQWKNLMVMLLPHYHAEGKTRLTLAVGCTGGKHRSVCMASALMEALEEHFPSYQIKLQHREALRWQTNKTVSPIA